MMHPQRSFRHTTREWVTRKLPGVSKPGLCAPEVCAGILPALDSRPSPCSHMHRLLQGVHHTERTEQLQDVLPARVSTPRSRCSIPAAWHPVTHWQPWTDGNTIQQQHTGCYIWGSHSRGYEVSLLGCHYHVHFQQTTQWGQEVSQASATLPGIL